MSETSDLIIIKTSAKYKISRDKYQFILFKAKKKPTEHGEWDTVGYYPSLKDIFNKLVTINLLENTEKKNLLDIVRTTCSKLERSVETAIKDGVLSQLETLSSDDLLAKSTNPKG